MAFGVPRERKDLDHLITAEEARENFLAGGYQSPRYDSIFTVQHPDFMCRLQGVSDPSDNGERLRKR